MDGARARAPESTASGVEPVLGGVRVIDLGSPISAYCTRILADLGADVVLVEAPEGDPLRHVGSFRDTATDLKSSLTYAYYHANKDSVVADQGAPEGQALIAQLCHDADVVVISPSAQRPLWNFDREQRRLDHAGGDTIVCSITPFGLTGPYRDRPATHLTSFAQSGAMCRIGDPSGPPRPIPGQLHWHLAATHAAVCVLAALGVRDRVAGQMIDISAQEVEISHNLQFEVYDRAGLNPGGRTAGIGIPPTGTWECSDGTIDIAAYQHRHWAAFLAMLDQPEVLMEPALEDMALRKMIFDGVNALIGPLLAEQSAATLVEKGQAAGLPVSPYNTPSSFVSDPQLRARDFFENLGRPESCQLLAPGPAVRTVPRLFHARRPAPLLGEHQDQHALGQGRTKPVTHRAMPQLDLSSMRVLTFGEFIAGSTAGQLLAGLGAQVVKIESRSHPSALRTAAFNYGPALASEPSGVTITATNASLNRGMKGVALEMSDRAAQAVLDLIAARSAGGRRVA